MAEKTILQKRLPIKELIGLKFGRLTVQSVSESRPKYLVCLCDCGTTKEVSRSNLGRCIFGCGCIRTEMATKRVTKHGANCKDSDPKLAAMWRCWRGMKSRCTYPSRPDFPHYGGRGITFSERYKSFDNFREDFWDVYQKGLEIERIDVNGNYEKENITFVTHRQQLWNMRKTWRVFFEGSEVSVQSLAERFGIPFARLRSRIQRQGMTPEEAVQKPSRYSMSMVGVKRPKRKCE